MTGSLPAILTLGLVDISLREGSDNLSQDVQ